MGNPTQFLLLLRDFAKNSTKKFSIHAEFNPEDQLKPLVTQFLSSISLIIKSPIDTVTEVQLSNIGGRPDVGVTVKSVLTGYVELKAPGKGADTSKLKGSDKDQWAKFRNLPNVIYTDGNQWALYRTGERVGNIVKLSGDITINGMKAVDDTDADRLGKLLVDFLEWEPIVPTSPKALAKCIAPLCRLLRSDVLSALQDPESNLSKLAHDWREYLFPDADDDQFADAYAETLTYALLLAEFSGAESLNIPVAVKTIRTGHKLLSDALKILSHEDAREEIALPIDLLERVIGAIDVDALSQKDDGDPWLYFYEDFLEFYDPKMRKDRGVYYTPGQAVRMQVNLVAELLEDKFGIENSFANPGVVTLDPAAGTGTRNVSIGFGHRS